MAYDQKFKIKQVNRLISHREQDQPEHLEINIPRQTLSRWLKQYKRYGKRALENKKPGPRETKINERLEKLILKMWKERQRSVYRMRIDLKSRGYSISERQIRKVYIKHDLKNSKNS